MVRENFLFCFKQCNQSRIDTSARFCARLPGGIVTGSIMAEADVTGSISSC